jgi:hypothetical protein
VGVVGNNIETAIVEVKNVDGTESKNRWWGVKITRNGIVGDGVESVIIIEFEEGRAIEWIELCHCGVMPK